MGDEAARRTDGDMDMGKERDNMREKRSNEESNYKGCAVHESQ